MGIRIIWGSPTPLASQTTTIRKAKIMTKYKKQDEQKRAINGDKRRPGQSGYDGNSELRTRVVQFNLSPSEYERLVEQYLKSSCSTIAAYCRDRSLSVGASLADKKQVKIEQVAELYKLSRETDISHTGRMGSNLNQIARKLNSHEGFSNFKEKMLGELKLMREMNRRLEKALIRIAGGDL